ncbi:hypothetical protein CWC31_14850 [Pseudoalteromonas ruthenica]|uniref:Ig-like domain-containing protein n=1 Tax=Pseudoalteromonas ruthenica TaxID=151081 RepID=UPI001108B9B8|nr:Ig-like domain-containing protein [Pseudoalteromonas ruthenica]TLX49745.1 hypothetical protein CWC31_14850 [Pseudoalteromonas ruthenica]
MIQFKANKLAGMLVPLGLSALPSLAGAYSGYIRNETTRSTSQSVTLQTSSATATHLPLKAKQFESSELAITQGAPSAQANNSTLAEPNLVSGQNIHEIMVIDATLKDKSTFYKALKPGVDIIEIDDNSPVMAQLNKKLQSYRNISAIHWVSHGSSGQIHIGQQRIDSQQLQQSLVELNSLGNKLHADADIHFYNCNLAKGKKGKEFVELFSVYTGADVAASDDLTGAASKQGDWQLEIVQGSIESTLPFSTAALQDFSGVLASYNAGSFCPLTAPDNGECANSVISSNGNLSATAPPSSFVQHYSTTNALYAFNNSFPDNAYLIFAKNGAYGNFDLDSLEIDVDGTCDITVTNNSGATIYSQSGMSGGTQTLSLSGNNTNISSFKVTGTNCSPNATYFGVVSFDTSVAITNTPPSIGNLDGDSVSLFPGAQTLLDQGTAATITDGDSANFDGGAVTVTIVSGKDSAEDLLSVDTSGTVALAGTTAGSNVSVSGTTIGTLVNNIAAGNDFVVNLNTDATAARVQTLLQQLSFENIDTANPTTGTRTVRVTVSDGDGGTSTNQDVSVTVQAPLNNGDLIPAAGVSEPVLRPTTSNSPATAVDVLDFTLVDGGGDNLPMNISSIQVQVNGTATEYERSSTTWRLNGPDANNIVGNYIANTLTFSGLNISIADGTQEDYVINAYYHVNTNMVDKRTFILSVNGQFNVIESSGTTMGATTQVDNGTGSVLDITATGLYFRTQPSGSISGNVLSTTPEVRAVDDFGNTDKDFTEIVTLTEASAGSLSNASVSATQGVASFSSLIYTATADQQSFTLTADDEATGADFASVDANSITSDVVATRLRFDTEPAPTAIPAGQSTSFTTVPQVSAVDAAGVVDTGYSTDILLAEVNGAGSVTMTATGDNDGNGATVTVTPSSGMATFTNLALNYTLSGASAESFNLRASSGALTAADSAQLTAADNVPPSVTSIALAGTPAANDSSITYTITFSKNANNISTDDFTLTTVSGTASGDIASVSASSGSSVNITVNNIAGTGSIRLDLNANTDIVDDSGNGNNNNGYVPAFNSGETHNVDVVAPQISSISVPADGTYKTGDTLDFTLNSNENLTVNTAGGTPSLTIDIGGSTVAANYLSGSGTAALNFRTAALAAGLEDTNGIGLTALTLAGGTINDNAGNALDVTLNNVGALSGVLVDSIAPTVTSVSATTSDGAYGAGEIINVGVTFSEAINVTGGVPSLTLETGATDRTVAYSSGSGTNTLMFTYTVQAGDTSADLDYTTTSALALNGAQVSDSAGNNASLTLATPGAAGSLGANKALVIDTTAPVSPTVTTPSAPESITSTQLAVAGTHSENGVNVALYADANDDGTADSTSVLASSAVSGNAWSLSAPLTLGDNNFVVAALDAAGNISTYVDVATITRDNPPNDTPVISGTPAGTAVVDDVYLFTPTASDNDGDALTFSVINLPAWATFNSNSGQLRGLPKEDDIGNYENIIISVSDGSATDSLPAFSISVIASNQAPIISGTPATTIKSGQSYSFTPTASDPDDDALTFSVVNQPSWTTFDTATGQLQGTPSESDVGTVSNIQITVSDGDLSAQLPAFAIEVTEANQAPRIITRTFSVEEDTSKTVTLEVDDEQAEQVTITVVSAPVQGELLINGLSLTYTPNTDFQGTDSATLIASDGDLQSEPVAIEITVTGVNDKPIANDDTLSLTRNDSGTYILEVLSNDSDPDQGDTLRITTASAELGDVAIDNGALLYTPPGGLNETTTLRYRIADEQGLADTATVRFSLDGPMADDIPVLSLPADVSVDATGLYTKVNLGVATAVDATGKAIAVRILDNPVYFKPGVYKIYWQATDDQGRSALQSQRVEVNPQASLSAQSIITEGRSHSITAYLNGPAPSYPLIMPFTVSGSSSSDDHSLTNAELRFTSEQATIDFDVFADALDEEDETITITLDESINRGSTWQHQVTITQRNLAPQVKVTAQQNAQAMTLFVADQDIELVAQVSDANINDSHTYQWQINPTLPLNQSSSERAIIEASDLTPGIYNVSLEVTDSGTPAASQSVKLQLDVRSMLPPLSDNDSDGDLIPDASEGYRDSDGDGVADYLDAIGVCHLLAATPAQEDNFIVETEYGNCLQTSIFADAASAGAELMPEQVASDEDTRHVGTLYGVVVSALPVPGAAVDFVLPQRQPLPQNALYRKYINDQWQDLHTQGDDAVASALGSKGYCPAPGSELWQPGLTAGHWCVQLTLTDGGANDADGIINGSIVDPGVVAIALDANQPPVANDDVYTVAENAMPMLNVLSNDTDAESDEIMLTGVEAELGDASIIDGKIQYQTPSQFIGNDRLIYSIRDAAGNSHSAEVSINIVANQAPVAVADSASVAYQGTVTVDVLANDSDPEGQALTVTQASSEHGEVVINSDFSLRFSAADGFSGNALVRYTLSDELGATTEGELNIEVAQKVTPPEPGKPKPPAKKSDSGTLAWLVLLLALVAIRRQIKQLK